MTRFVDEAKQLKSLQLNPSVAKVREFFRENGTAYLVMDFEDGFPLSQILSKRETDRHPFDEASLLAVSIPLLEAITKVHDAGFLHRDIKPSNVLIRQTDGLPILIDFGSAKQFLAGKTKSIAPYTDGYAAPEQVGEGAIGPWTDMYSIGAMLWRIVAGGNPPWIPPDPVKVQSRIFAQLRDLDDPLPSARQLGSERMNPSILGAIDRCLSLDSSNRFQSAKDMLNELRSCHSTTQDVDSSIRTRSDQSAATELSEGKLAYDRGHYNTAYRRFLEASSLGSARARTEIALLYLSGKGVPKDDNTALKWFSKAADQGDAEAQYNLGLLRRNSKDLAGWNDPRVVELFERAGKSGHPGAQYELGLLYINGNGVAQDYEQGISWLHMAAEADFGTAQNLLGRLYYEGVGVTKDCNEAARWFRQAAKQGIAEAQFNLGLMHTEGSGGVPRDFKKAARLFRQASTVGHAGAQNWLGHLYMHGNGVEKDLEVAKNLLESSADQGNDEASKALSSVKYKLARRKVSCMFWIVFWAAAIGYLWYKLSGG